jgi:hypothetical protein
MSYLKTIEFLVQELAKKDEQIENLIKTDEDNQSVIKRLSSVHDKHMEMLSDKDNEVEELEAVLEFTEHKLKEMTIEKDHWKEEALDYRNTIEPEWFDKEKQYKKEIEKHKDCWATEFAYNHLKKEYDSIKDYYEERIAKLQVEINHLKHNK